MLVLTRKLQEKIHIGDNITLTIVKVKGNTVRVGIEAPREVRIVRGELPQKEQPATEEEEAAEDAPAAMQTFTLPLNELAKALAGSSSLASGTAASRKPKTPKSQAKGPLTDRLRANSASAV